MQFAVGPFQQETIIKAMHVGNVFSVHSDRGKVSSNHVWRQQRGPTTLKGTGGCTNCDDTVRCMFTIGMEFGVIRYSDLQQKKE